MIFEPGKLQLTHFGWAVENPLNPAYPAKNTRGITEIGMPFGAPARSRRRDGMTSGQDQRVKSWQHRASVQDLLHSALAVLRVLKVLGSVA